MKTTNIKHYAGAQQLSSYFTKQKHLSTVSWARRFVDSGFHPILVPCF